MSGFWISRVRNGPPIFVNMTEFWVCSEDAIMKVFWIFQDNKYAWIYLNKQSSKHTRILNVCNAVHSIRSLYKLLSSYRDRSVFRALPKIKMERFTKRKVPGCRHTTGYFSGLGRFQGSSKFLVKLPTISLQACKFTKNELFHTYFSRILASF